MRDAVKQSVAPASARYGAGAITFHWTTAALIVFLGSLGLLFEDIPREARPFWINVHVCVGLLYLALVIARLLWRATHTAPELPPDVGEFSRRASFAVHNLLYVLMLLIPLLGVVARVWHGRSFDYGVFQMNFGVASNPAIFHPAEKIHQLSAYALFALAGLHAAAAVYHHFVRRDGILLRMMTGEMGRM
jgi:cytochrome b561